MIAPGAATASTWLQDAESWSPERAVDLGPTLVVAPHPDDEALGCGGLIALLRHAQVPVRVVVVSDGAASHPGSVRYPPPVLGALRRSESLAGLGVLGVAPEQVTFLGLPDGAVPTADAPGASAAWPKSVDGACRVGGSREEAPPPNPLPIAMERGYRTATRHVLPSPPQWGGVGGGAPLDGLAPRGTIRAVDLACDALRRWPDTRTVLLPWRRDPHDDHRAAWSLFSAALDAARSPARRLEYPIWTLVHPAPGDLPCPGEVDVRRLDIGSVVAQKRDAILAHRSQTTALIDDAEIGHCLTESVLAHLTRPWELLIEVRP